MQPHDADSHDSEAHETPAYESPQITDISDGTTPLAAAPGVIGSL